MSILSLFGKLFSILRNLVQAVSKSKKKEAKRFTISPNIVCYKITKNLSLLTNENNQSKITDFRLDQPQEKPLVVLFCWMMAKKKYTNKFAEIWMEKGFDVLTITINAWNFVWPVLGTQLVAADVLKFLDRNKSYTQIMLHGFSVGGYQWSEVLVKIAQDLDRYQHIVDKIVGQVWDSAGDVAEVPVGVPVAVFPNNKLLEKVLRKYLEFHLKIFYKVVTRHYAKASQVFHSGLVKAPALIIISKTDPIGSESSNQALRNSWENAGLKSPKSWAKIRPLRGLSGIGFRLTSDGQCDIEGRSLTNVADPRNDKDAVTRDYVYQRFTISSNFVCIKITENLSLLTNEKNPSKITDFRLDQPREKPLVLLFGWTMAKKKHTDKFAEIWIEKGFDVLNITITAWNFIWPVLGTQLVAVDILKFLDRNKSYTQIMLHGFSVGGYQWSEVLIKITQDMNRYQHIMDKIVGHVWDSTGGVEEASLGIAVSVFPNNKLLEKVLRKYLEFHLKIFYKVATRHYANASQMFHSGLVKAPALMIISKTDPIGSEGTNQAIRNSWENAGLKVHWKVFENSPHVGHFRKYPEEYMVQLNMYLDSLSLTNTE